MCPWQQSATGWLGPTRWLRPARCRPARPRSRLLPRSWPGMLWLPAMLRCACNGRRDGCKRTSPLAWASRRRRSIWLFGPPLRPDRPGRGCARSRPTPLRTSETSTPNAASVSRCATHSACVRKLWHSDFMPHDAIPSLDAFSSSSAQRRSLSAHRDVFLPSPTPEGIKRFQSLYRRKFGVDLDSQEALELATRTLHFIFLATTPCPYKTDSSHSPAECSNPIFTPPAASPSTSASLPKRTSAKRRA